MTMNDNLQDVERLICISLELRKHFVSQRRAWERVEGFDKNQTPTITRQFDAKPQLSLSFH